MYTHLKKSTSMIILASIVATTNISMFIGYATGPSSDVQTELGGSSLTVGCSKLHHIKLSDELTYEENDELCNKKAILCRELVEQSKKALKSRQDMKKLDQQFHDIALIIQNLQQAINSSCKELVKNSEKNKKIFAEQNRQFNLKCEELEKQFKIAEEIINQLNENSFIHSRQQNAFHNLTKNDLEIEAKYYNLCQFEEYNKNYKNFCNIMKEQALCAINLFKIKHQRNKVYLDMEKKYLEFIKQLAVEDDNRKPTLHQLDLNNLSVLKKLSQSKSNQQWVKTLHEYINLKDEYTKLDNILTLSTNNIKIKTIELQQIERSFKEEKVKMQDEILAKYNAEHARPKIGASAPIKYDNKDSENNNLESSNSALKINNSPLESDASDSSKGTGQAKIDKSSDYNKEKKLRLKEEKKKNKKIVKRGTTKAKDINYSSENSQENASMIIKAKIIRKEEPDTKSIRFDAKDNDSDETSINMQSDSSNEEENIEDISDDSIESEDTMELDSHTDDSKEMLEHDFIKQYIPNAQFFRFDQ